MKRIACIFVFLLFLAPDISSALGVEVAVGGWGQSPDGYVGYKAITQADNLDLGNDAKYDDEFRGYVRAKFDLPLFLPNIYLMYTPMEFEGTGQKSANFKFGDQPAFTAATDFYSKLVLDHYDVAVYYGIPFIETLTGDRLSAEFGINVRIIDLSAQVTQGSYDESTSQTIPMPMVYIGLRVQPFKWLAIEAEGRGISYDDNSYFDYIGRVKYHPFKMPMKSLYIAGGYRHEQIEIDEKDIKADLTFSGPFAEVGLDF
ncbi:MAG: TIGR04219 family outer membrane beta-barrel protein [Proteobacteria bacterium]|nr:TIGR04219 family outer membrane beta-barrel protein [Pseudomonadota bacterium]MBU1710977.1 TIGR04219 family outer membrane beta-barrel protein [Pseudomonadota bacterium]